MKEGNVVSNSSMKAELQRIYGKGCMFRKAEIAKQIEEMGGIKTYRRYVQETRYKRRRINLLENRLTYHHLQHRSEGGLTDLNNGAVINELAHRYLHSLPRDEEEVINDMLRYYKLKLRAGILVPTDLSMEIIQPQELDIEYEEDDDYITISAYDTEKEEYDKKFNRAKHKEETRKLIDELLQEDEEIDLDY